MLHHHIIKLAIFFICINALVESQPLGSTDKVRQAPGKSQAIRNPFAPNSEIFKIPVLKTINLDFRNANNTTIQTELLRVLKNSLQNKSLQQEKLILNVKPPKNSNSSFAKNFTSLLKNETTYLVPDGIVGAQSTIFKKKNGEISNLRLTLYVIRQKQSSVNKKSQKTKTHHAISPETLTEKANINVTQTENITATIGSVLKQLYENSTDNENFQNINIILSLISPSNFSLGQIKNLRQSIRQIVLELYPNTTNSIEARLLYKKKTHTSKLEFEIDIQSPKKKQEPLKQKLNLTMKSSDEEIDKSLQTILKTLKTDLQKLIPDSDLVVQAQKVISDDLHKLSETLQSHREEPIKIKTSMALTNGDSSFEKELDKLLPSILKKANESLKPVLLAFKITIPNDSTQDSISSDVCFLIKTLTNRIPAKTPFGDLDIELTLIPKFENQKPTLKLAYSMSEILPESRKLSHVSNITMPKILNLTEPKINIIKKINSTIVELAKQLSYNNTNEENQFNISLIIPQNETKEYVESILNIMQEDIRILFPYTRILIQAQDMISKGLRILKLNIKLVNELEQEEKKADVLPIDLSKLDNNVSQGLEELLKPWLPYMKRKRPTTFDLKLRPVNDLSRPRLGNDICSIVDTLNNILPKGISMNDIILQTTVLPDKEQKLPEIGEYSGQKLQNRVYNTLKELAEELANHTNTITKGLNFTLSIQSQGNLTTQENTEEIIRTIKEDLFKLAPYADIIIELQKSIEDELNTLELNINLQYKKPIKKFKIDLNELGEFLPEEVDEVVYNIRNSKNPFSFALEMAIPEDTDLEAANSEICSVSNVVINNIPKESLLTGSILRVTVSPSTENNLKNENSKEQLKNYIPFNPTTEEENILPFKSPTDKIDSNRYNRESVSNDSEEKEEKKVTSEIPSESRAIDSIQTDIEKFLTPFSFPFPKKPISISSQQSQKTEPLENLNSDVSEVSEVPERSAEINQIQNIKEKPKNTNKNMPYIDKYSIAPSSGPLSNQMLNQNHKLHALRTPSSDLSQEKTMSEVPKKNKPIKPTKNTYKPQMKNKSLNIPDISKRPISPMVPSYQRIQPSKTTQRTEYNVSPSSADLRTPITAEKSQVSPISDQIYKLPLLRSPKSSDITSDLKKRLIVSPGVLVLPSRTGNTESINELSSEIQPSSTGSYDIYEYDDATSRCVQEDWEPNLEYPESQETMTGQPEDIKSQYENVTVENNEIETPEEENKESYITTETNELELEPTISRRTENLLRTTTNKPTVSKKLQGLRDDILSGINSFTSAIKSIVQRQQTQNPINVEAATTFKTETKNIPIPQFITENMDEFMKPQVEWKEDIIPSTTSYTENRDEVEILPRTAIPLNRIVPQIISETEITTENWVEINKQTPHKPGIESENVNIVKKIPLSNAYPTTSEKINNLIGKISPRSLSIPQKISKTRTNIPVVNSEPKKRMRSNIKSLINKPQNKLNNSPSANPKTTGESEDFLGGTSSHFTRIPEQPHIDLETENIPLADSQPENTKVEEASSENILNENVKANGRITKQQRLHKNRSSKRRRHMKRGPKHSNIKQNLLIPNKKANNKFPSTQKLDENKIKTPLIKAFDNDQKDVLKYVENLDLSNSSRNLNDTILNIAISAVKVIPRDVNETLELILNILPPSNITVNTVMNITDSVLSSLVSLYPNDIVNVVTGITDKNYTITRLQIEITISNNKKLINQIEKENNLQDKLQQESKVVQNLTKILDALVEDVKRETVMQNDLQSVPYYETSLKDIKSFLKTSLYTVVSEISSSVEDNSKAKNLNFTFSLNAPVVVNRNFVEHFKDLLRIILVNSLPFDDISVAAKLLKNNSKTAITLDVDLEPRKVFTTSPIDLDDLNILDVEWVLSENIFGYISGLKKAQVPNKSIIINFVFETSHISSLNLHNIESAIGHVFDSLKIQGELRTEDIKLGLTRKNKIIINLPFLISSSDFGPEEQEATTTPKPLEIISDLILAI